MRARIMGEDTPMLVVFSTCTDFIRTVPVLQHDEDHPEDIDTESEDHAGDEGRYACMSRPWIRPIERAETKPVLGIMDMSWDQAVTQHSRQRRGRL